VRDPAEDLRVQEESMKRQMELVQANNKTMGPDGEKPNPADGEHTPGGDQPKKPTQKPNVAPKTEKMKQGTQNK
jgi:hypothetical protein